MLNCCARRSCSFSIRGNEPGKAEGLLAPGGSVRVGKGLRLRCEQYQLARIALLEIGGAERCALRRAGFEQDDALVVGCDDQRQSVRRFVVALGLIAALERFARGFGACPGRPEHGETGQGHALDFVRGARLPLRLEAQRRSGLEQGGRRMRRGKLLFYEFGRKRGALELADGTQSPDEMHASQWDIERHRRPLTGLWPNWQADQRSKKAFQIQ